MKAAQTIVYEHLYQIYPSIPKYANDPQQSQIIRVYDLLLKRYQGIYGQEPKYFIRSPATLTLLGSANDPINMSVATICSLQNIIICVSTNGYQKIRINHYQSAVYGEKVFENQQIKWKYQNQGDDYSNLLTASLKAFSSMLTVSTMVGLDILIYDDFVKDQHLNWAEALCLGMGYAIFSVTKPINSISNLTSQFWLKYLGRISNIVHSVKKVAYPLIGEHNKITISSNMESQQCSIRQIQFPKEYDIIIAHSMTPLPKKMTQGKRQNLRSCQVYIGIEIIKNQLGLAGQVNSLKQLQRQLNCSIKQLLEMVEEYIPKQDLNAEKIQQLTDKSLIQILKAVPFANNVIDENLVYKPYKRIKYYLQEQLDIQEIGSQNIVKLIERNFQKSKDLLEIRSDQIDQMIQICKGMVSTFKIIGDGWGGYLLILCEPKNTKVIVDQLIKNFYMNQKNKMLLSDDVDQYIKAVGKPSTSLAILDASSQIWFC